MHTDRRNYETGAVSAVCSPGRLVPNSHGSAQTLKCRPAETYLVLHSSLHFPRKTTLSASRCWNEACGSGNFGWLWIGSPHRQASSLRFAWFTCGTRLPPWKNIQAVSLPRQFLTGTIGAIAEFWKSISKFPYTPTVDPWVHGVVRAWNIGIGLPECRVGSLFHLVLRDKYSVDGVESCRRRWSSTIWETPGLSNVDPKKFRKHNQMHSNLTSASSSNLGCWNMVD